MLMQHFGRCTWDTGHQGVAILIAEPKWIYHDEESPKLGKKRKITSQPGTEQPQCKARKTQLSAQPMDSHDDDLGVHMCAEDSLHVDVAEDDPGTGGMEVDSPEMLIG